MNTPNKSPHSRKIAVVHPSGILSRPPGFQEERNAHFEERGFELHHFPTECPSENTFATGTATERAVLFAHALTSRKYPILWAARGGSGVSEILFLLENMLPPVLPPKTFIGFSDNSLLGCYLALRHPNIRYIHANHIYDPALLHSPGLDGIVLSQLLEGKSPEPLLFRVEPPAYPSSAQPPHFLEARETHLVGPLVPLNACLAHILSAVPGCTLPQNNVLFLEDLNEEVYRFLRSIDGMRLAGFFENTQAIVLGTFSNCAFNNNKPSTEREIADLLARKLRLPVYVLPVFGHDRWRLPLVFGAPVRLSKDEILISFDPTIDNIAVSSFKAAQGLPRSSSSHSQKPKIHFTGIGGTGMAAVAGLFAASHFPISGSDGPIYPPMDKTLRDIGVQPMVGYRPENISGSRPDAVVLANVVSRRNAELKPNLEFEALLQDAIPLFSFPSALRHFFLHKARNVVVSGTHGKTTTTSFLAHLLTGVGENPSFMIGGTPKNFGIGFALRDPSLFVLEGDEYDSALFDKGPKFLHYEPTVALINNIEFDHADIYADVEAIEREFERLVALCMARGGVVVANAGDERVRRIASEYASRVIWFGTEKDVASVKTAAAWTLLSLQATKTGMDVSFRTPWGETCACALGLFGTHNALNAMAALASVQALHLHAHFQALHKVAPSVTPPSKTAFEAQASLVSKTFPLVRALAACGSFEGVKRRFELVGQHNDIRVYDDFAHHPTAIDTTLAGFKAYLAAAGVKGRLVACFDPRNATMRRRVLQDALAKSFAQADLVFLGKVAVDKRLAEDETLDGPGVQKSIGEKCRYFFDNEEMCDVLRSTLKPGDTVVFMSSGAFDGLPQKLFQRLTES